MLAFDQQALVHPRQFVGDFEDQRVIRRALLVDVAFCAAALHAMLAGRWQSQWRQEAVERIDLSTRHHRQRAAEQAVQVVQQRH